MERREKMFQLEILFFMQIGIGILLVFLLHKISQIKAQVDDIISEVKDYITFITEDTQDSEADTFDEKQDFHDEKQFFKDRSRKIRDKEDVQTQLIQAVLGEYFP